MGKKFRESIFRTCFNQQDSVTKLGRTDLHSNNSVVTVEDEESYVAAGGRFPISTAIYLQNGFA